MWLQVQSPAGAARGLARGSFSTSCQSWDGMGCSGLSALGAATQLLEEMQQSFRCKDL